jgi:hypothetical protein
MSHISLNFGLWIMWPRSFPADTFWMQENSQFCTKDGDGVHGLLWSLCWFLGWGKKNVMRKWHDVVSETGIYSAEDDIPGVLQGIQRECWLGDATLESLSKIMCWTFRLDLFWIPFQSVFNVLVWSIFMKTIKFHFVTHLVFSLVGIYYFLDKWCIISLPFVAQLIIFCLLVNIWTLILYNFCDDKLWKQNSNWSYGCVVSLFIWPARPISPTGP